MEQNTTQNELRESLLSSSSNNARQEEARFQHANDDSLQRSSNFISKLTTAVENCVGGSGITNLTDPNGTIISHPLSGDHDVGEVNFNDETDRTIRSPNNSISNGEERVNSSTDFVSYQCWFDMYTNLLCTFRHFILGITIVLLWPVGIGIAYGKFTSLTDSSFHTIKNSKSDLAAQAFRKAYDVSRHGGISNSTSIPFKKQIDWNEPTNSPLLLLLEEAKCSHYDRSHAFSIDGEQLTNEFETELSYYTSPMTNDIHAPSYQSARNFSIGLLDYLMNVKYNCWQWPPEVFRYSDKVELNGITYSNQTNYSECIVDEWIKVTSYYSLLENDLSFVGNSTMKSPSGDTALIIVQYAFPEFIQQTKYKKNRVAQLMYSIDRYKKLFFQSISINTSSLNTTTTESCTDDGQLFSVRYTGIKYFGSDLLLSTKHDVKRMHMIVLPLALLLIGIVLPSSNPAYTWIIPVTTILTTISLWSLIMWGVSTLLSRMGTPPISTFTPTIMSSLSLGLGIDYTLFLLARYLEERVLLKRTSQTAVKNMLCGSGHVLLLSGITLAACFMGLMFLPLSLLQSFGIGASIAVLTSLGVNLIIVPTLLYTVVGERIIICNDKPHTNNGILMIGGSRRSDRNRAHSTGARSVHFADTARNTNSNPDPVEENSEQRETEVEVAALLQNQVNDSVTGDIHNNIDDDEDELVNESIVNAVSDLLSQEQLPIQSKRSIWLFSAKHLLHPYKGILVLVIAFQFMFPIARHAGQVKSSLSFDLLLPSKSPSLIVYHELETKMGGAGRLNPYRLLFDGHPANITMTSAQGFEVMQLVLDALQAIDRSPTDLHLKAQNNSDAQDQRDFIENDVYEFSYKIFNQIEFAGVGHRECGKLGMSNSSAVCLDSTQQKPSASYNGIAVLQNTPIPHAMYASAKYCGFIKPHCPVQLLHVLDEIDRTATSSDFMATYVTVTLMKTSPFSDEGIDWLNKVRSVISKLEASSLLQGVSVYIEGAGAIAQDAVSGVYKAFPTMIVVTTAIVFALMGLFFRSIVPPLRSIVSIGITVSFSFGLAVLVFQEGFWKDWTSTTRMWASTGDEICWLVPIMSFSIIVGLALDYDVFLISRILEYRMQSYEHRTSIACGLHATGGIITAAGLIMAVAFGSLMLSSNPVLYQWSFLLTVAVLLDTFVIRTVVVPVLTNLAGPQYCWWPRRFPSSAIVLPEYRPTLDPDDVAGLLRTIEETSEYEPLHITNP